MLYFRSVPLHYIMHYYCDGNETSLKVFPFLRKKTGSRKTELWDVTNIKNIKKMQYNLYHPPFLEAGFKKIKRPQNE